MSQAIDDVSPDAGTPRGRVAVLGMGRMGAAMAQHLAEEGFAVAVHNRSIEKARAVGAEIGADVMATPAAAAHWAAGAGPGGVILTSLADDAACRAVFLGADGLVGALTPGQVVGDTSTISADTARELDAAVAGVGAHYLNAPVSGSVPAALSGGLTVMVGGAAAALEAAGPVLHTIGKRVVPVGPPGSGSVVKLAVNAILHTFNQALSEAIVLVENAGVDRSVFYGVVSESVVAAPFVGYKRDAFLDPDDAAVAFSIELMSKDLRLALALAASVDADMPSTDAAADAAGRAIDAGYGDADMSAMAEFLRRR